MKLTRRRWQWTTDSVGVSGVGLGEESAIGVLPPALANVRRIPGDMVRRRRRKQGADVATDVLARGWMEDGEDGERSQGEDDENDEPVPREQEGAEHEAGGSSLRRSERASEGVWGMDGR